MTHILHPAPARALDDAPDVDWLKFWATTEGRIKLQCLLSAIREVAPQDDSADVTPFAGSRTTRYAALGH